tara:strand:- start:5316 stop:5960 length:645 start_codon:yes stop_codon:yes gene_type:complete
MNKNIKYIVLSLAVVGVGLYFMLREKLSRYKRQVVFQSNSEVDKWKRYNELSPETAQILKQYWKDGVGLNFSDDEVLSSDFQSTWAWSAAFISWIMKVSGAKNFPAHQTHAHYVRATMDNTLKDKGEFKAYSLEDEKPAASDIVCKRRGNSTATFGNVPVGDTLHCDIVTDVFDGYIEVVGGNANNRVEKSKLTIDKKGFLNAEDYFVIIKNTL